MQRVPKPKPSFNKLECLTDFNLIVNFKPCVIESRFLLLKEKINYIYFYFSSRIKKGKKNFHPTFFFRRILNVQDSLTSFQFHPPI